MAVSSDGKRLFNHVNEFVEKFSTNKYFVFNLSSHPVDQQ